MRSGIIIMGFSLIVMILIAGCTSPQSGVPTGSNNASEDQTTTATTFPSVSPSKSMVTPSSRTMTPQNDTVTSGPLKKIKDPELWFTMQVPESWEVTTERMSNPEGYEGLLFVTYLFNNPLLFNTHEFYILTYAITRDFDNAVRNSYRVTWTPRPHESTVTINGIIFDRFESRTDDYVKVAYVVRKASANERGFASIIEYKIDSSSQYQQKEYESLISTFRYIPQDDIEDTVGEEIKRPDGIPLFR